MKCSECRCGEMYTDRYGRTRYMCTYDLPDEMPCERNGGHWEDEEEYTPSASAGDYSPSSPWNAPGMSIHDFI